MATFKAALAFSIAVAISLVAIATESYRATASPTTTTTTTTLAIPLRECQTNKNLNDYRLNECLIEQIHLARVSLATVLRRESVYFGVPSPATGRRVVDAAQSAFQVYARKECLAQATPYTGGTIYPIVYGHCELSLLEQRLSLVRQEVTSFANLSSSSRSLARRSSGLAAQPRRARVQI